MQDTELLAKPGVHLSGASAKISEIWSDALGFDGFGIHDDFFGIGGDSLAALSVVARIEASFGTRLPTDVLQRSATVAGMAALLANPPAPPAPVGTTDLEARLRALTARWGGEPVEPGGLVRGRQRGAGRPWFWCVQTGAETVQIPAMLGERHSAYFMRSGYLVMAYDEASVSWLASRYLREVVKADPTGPYFLGGVCQGAQIAVEMARQLRSEGRPVALLACVDAPFWELFDGRPYDSPTVCVAGNRSRQNPRRWFDDPEAGWRKLLPGGTRLLLLPCDHQDLFRGASAEAFAVGMREAHDWAAAAASVSPCPGAGALPRDAYFCQLVAPPRLLLLPGEACSLPVRVRNLGSVAWEAGAGIALGNHWLRDGGELLTWSDGRTALDRVIAPGEHWEARLRVRAPSRPGRYLLEFDMVEEGVAWFKDRGGATAATEVSVGIGLASARAALSRKRQARGSNSRHL